MTQSNPSNPAARSNPRSNPYAPPGVRYYAAAKGNDGLAENGQNLVTMVLVFLSLGQVAPAILIVMGRLPFVPYGLGVIFSLALYRLLYKGSNNARMLFLAGAWCLVGYLAYLGIRWHASLGDWLILAMVGFIPALAGLFFWKTPSVRAFYGVDG